MKQFYSYPCKDFLECMEYYDVSLESEEEFAKSHCVNCPDCVESDIPYSEAFKKGEQNGKISNDPQ